MCPQLDSNLDLGLEGGAQVTLGNPGTNGCFFLSTSIQLPWHLWEIDLRFALEYLDLGLEGGTRVPLWRPVRGNPGANGWFP